MLETAAEAGDEHSPIRVHSDARVEAARIDRYGERPCLTPIS